MYKYKSIKKQSVSSNDKKSISEMSLNGIYLSEVVPGYRQLTVSGRGLTDTEFNTFKNDFTGLESVLNRKLKAKTITVKYQLMAKNVQDFRFSFNKLNDILINAEDNMFYIKFDDEPTHGYYGYFIDGAIIEENDLYLVSEFNLFIPDPRKYSEEKTHIGQSTDIISGFGGMGGLLLTYLSVTASSNTVTLNIGDKYFYLNTKPGDVIELYWNRNKTQGNRNFSCVVNGVEDFRVLDLWGDIENSNYIKTTMYSRTYGATGGNINTIKYQHVYY